MTEEETTAADAEKQAQADFDSGGVAGTSTAKAAVVEATKPEKEAAKSAAEPLPKYAQITEAELAELRAAAAKTASYDQQFSKAFGTIGNLQKTLSGLRDATPRGGAVTIPDDAFAEMAKEFPELAAYTKAGLEAALKGIAGTGAAADIDPATLKQMVREHARESEREALEDAHPDWRAIVGAIDATKEQPDPANPFRKWLGTKDAAYQTKVNGTESAAVIARAIRLFQSETKAQPKPLPNPKVAARVARISEAVQPKGDGGHPTSRNTAEDEFAEGFASR